MNTKYTLVEDEYLEEQPLINVSDEILIWEKRFRVYVNKCDVQLKDIEKVLTKKLSINSKKINELKNCMGDITLSIRKCPNALNNKEKDFVEQAMVFYKDKNIIERMNTVIKAYDNQLKPTTNQNQYNKYDQVDLSVPYQSYQQYQLQNPVDSRNLVEHLQHINVHPRSLVEQTVIQ